MIAIDEVTPCIYEYAQGQVFDHACSEEQQMTAVLFNELTVYLDWCEF